MEIQITNEERADLIEIIDSNNSIKDLMSIETYDTQTEIKRLEKIVLLLIRKVNALEKKRG